MDTACLLSAMMSIFAVGARSTIRFQIRAEFKASRETYDSPRVHDAGGECRAQSSGDPLMRENGLCVRPRRGFRCTTTVRNPDHAVALITLDRDFAATAPNEKWIAVVMLVLTDEGWLYLASMLDLYIRKIVGWAMDDTNDQLLT